MRTAGGRAAARGAVDAVHVYPAEARPLDVLGEADRALYEAKRAGRDAAVVRILEFD